MLPQRNSVKIVLFLATWTLLLFGFIKLQNDYTISQNMLQLNEKRLEFDNFEVSTNPEIDIHLKLKSSSRTKTTVKLKSTSTTASPEIDANTCNVTRPQFPDLQFDNIYWQTLNTTNGTIKIFRSFYDDRNESDIGPSIRIITMINRIEIQNVTTYCQFWFNEVETPIVSKIIDYKLIWHKEWGWNKLYVPFLLTCPYNFNKYHQIPEAVSLVTKNCSQAENYLKILNIRPKMNEGKKPFAVCVKDLNFKDQNMAIRLIEWIELLRILGADKIFIYQFHVTGKIREVFDYYERYGILEVVKLSYPKSQSLGRWSNEVVSLNDCLYRNIYLYDYLAIIDTDEIIIPKHPDDMPWMDLLERIKNNQTDHNKNYASYNFRNIYFLDDLQHNHDWHPEFPQYLHILQHTFRPTNYTPPGYSIKSFHSTELVKTVHNHYPMSCLDNNGWCKSFEVNTEFGHSAHYRRVCPGELKEVCKYYQNHTIEDKTVWKYKDELIKQSTKVINMLELVKDGKVKL